MAETLEQMKQRFHDVAVDWDQLTRWYWLQSCEGKLKDAVVEAANACITAWDDAKWPPSIPLRKALAALDASVSKGLTEISPGFKINLDKFKEDDTD